MKDNNTTVLKLLSEKKKKYYPRFENLLNVFLKKILQSGQ
jgi:hypothetical protein